MKIPNAKPFFPEDDIPLILDEIKKSLEKKYSISIKV